MLLLFLKYKTSHINCISFEHKSEGLDKLEDLNLEEIFNYTNNKNLASQQSSIDKIDKEKEGYLYEKVLKLMLELTRHKIKQESEKFKAQTVNNLNAKGVFNSNKHSVPYVNFPSPKFAPLALPVPYPITLRSATLAHSNTKMSDADAKLLKLVGGVKAGKLPYADYDPIPYFGTSRHPLGIPTELQRQIHLQSDSYGPVFNPKKQEEFPGFVEVKISPTEQFIQFPIEMYKTKFAPVPVSGNIVVGHMLGIGEKAGHSFPVKPGKGARSVFGYTRSNRFIGNFLYP